MDDLKAYRWPGNIRELRNIVERAMVITTGSTLRPKLPAREEKGDTSRVKVTLEDVNRNHILEVLNHTAWRISGQGAAADLLGIKPSTLRSRMDKLNIKRPL